MLRRHADFATSRHPKPGVGQSSTWCVRELNPSTKRKPSLRFLISFLLDLLGISKEAALGDSQDSSSRWSFWSTRLVRSWRLRCDVNHTTGCLNRVFQNPSSLFSSAHMDGGDGDKWQNVIRTRHEQATDVDITRVFLTKKSRERQPSLLCCGGKSINVVGGCSRDKKDVAGSDRRF